MLALLVASLVLGALAPVISAQDDVTLLPIGFGPDNSLAGEAIGTGAEGTTFLISGVTAGSGFTFTLVEGSAVVAETLEIPQASITAAVLCDPSSLSGGDALCEEAINGGTTETLSLTLAPVAIAVSTGSVPAASSGASSAASSGVSAVSSAASSASSAVSSGVSALSSAASSASSVVSSLTSALSSASSASSSISITSPSSTTQTVASVVSTAPAAATSSSAAQQVSFASGSLTGALLALVGAAGALL